MQILGDASTSRKRDRGYKDSVLSRSQFLKGMTGATAAAALAMSGGVAFAQKATSDGGEIATEQLEYVFEEINKIPNAVIARGDRASAEYLKMQLDETQSSQRSVSACLAAIGQTLVTSIPPIKAIRTLIRAYGGARALAFALQAAVDLGRSRGLRGRRLVNFVAGKVTDDVGLTSLAVALGSFLGVTQIYNGCIAN